MQLEQKSTTLNYFSMHLKLQMEMCPRWLENDLEFEVWAHEETISSWRFLPLASHYYDY